MSPTHSLGKAASGSAACSIPAISVVIPARNEERSIARTLAALRAQSLPAAPFEVILVDNGSADRTIEVARGFESVINLKVLERPGLRIAALRNQGAAEAAGEFLAFLDADCIPPADWLDRGVALLRAGRRRVIGAHCRVPENSSWVAKTWYGDRWRLKSGSVSYVQSGNMLVDHALFSELGGFDESLTTSEDCEFCQRASDAGMSIIAVPELSVVHLGTPQTLVGFYREERWHGKSVHGVVLRDIWHSRGLKSVIMAGYTLMALVALAIGCGLTALGGGPAPLGAAAAFLLMGPLLLAVSAGLARKRPGLVLPLAVMYLTYGIARALCLVGLSGQRLRQ